MSKRIQKESVVTHSTGDAMTVVTFEKYASSYAESLSVQELLLRADKQDEGEDSKSTYSAAKEETNESKASQYKTQSLKISQDIRNLLETS